MTIRAVAEHDFHAGWDSYATNCGTEVLHGVVVTLDCTSQKRGISGDDGTAADEEIGLSKKIRSNVPSDNRSVPIMPLSCTEYLGIKMKSFFVKPTSRCRKKRSTMGCAALLFVDPAPWKR